MIPTELRRRGLAPACPLEQPTRIHNPLRRMERWSMRLLPLLAVIGLALGYPLESSASRTRTADRGSVDVPQWHRRGPSIYIGGGGRAPTCAQRSY